MKRALTSGVTEQDGSYPADLLTARGYEVLGLVCQPAPIDLSRIGHLLPGPKSKRRESSFALHYMDRTDAEALHRFMHVIEPDEVYHLGAAPQVRVVLDVPNFVGDISGLDITRLLEAIRRLNHECRPFQSSSSGTYSPSDGPRDEKPRLEPRSPYDTATFYSYCITTICRELYGVFAVNGVLDSHDSPRRSEAFAPRRITRSAARATAGLSVDRRLNNVNSPQDLGYADGLQGAIRRILQINPPTHCLVATGMSSTLQNYVNNALRAVGLDNRESFGWVRKLPELPPPHRWATPRGHYRSSVDLCSTLKNQLASLMVDT